MGRRKLKLTKSQERLMKLFSEVEDEGIRDIMATAVLLEGKHRSAGLKNFPKQEIRDIVDTTAKLIEMGQDAQGAGDHAI